MFSRKLAREEVDLIRHIEDFVRLKHMQCEGHDWTHVLEVTRIAIEIAEQVPESVDPFLVVCGGLFHDIGRVNATSGSLHGLEGAAIADQFLRAVWADRDTIDKIVRIVTRHTPTSALPPETIEEKIVFDADTLERFGWIGILRGVMGKTGSIENILEEVIKKRIADYDNLYLDVSKEVARIRYENTLTILRGVEDALRRRDERVHQAMRLPVEGKVAQTVAEAEP